jgi:hypothetical protein
MENLATYFPGATIVNNAIIDGQPYNYPPGNFVGFSAADVQFASVATGDYRLTDASPFRHAGTDGLDLGADMVGLTAVNVLVTAGVMAPPPIGAPTVSDPGPSDPGPAPADPSAGGPVSPVVPEPAPPIPAPMPSDLNPNLYPPVPMP